MPLDAVRSLADIRTLRPDVSADMIGCVLALGYNPDYPNIVFDYSPKQNHGVMTGVTWTQRPDGLWVMDFGGTDYVSLPISPAITGLTVGAVEIWAYSDAIGDDIGVLYGFSDAGDASSFFSIDMNTVGADKRVRYFNRNDGVYSLGFGGTIDIADATWYHIIFQQTGSGYEAYVNGAVDTFLSVFGGDPTNTDWISYISDIDTMNLGRRVRSGGTTWLNTGKIGIVRIYDHIFSATQVQTRFHGGRLVEARELAPAR